MKTRKIIGLLLLIGGLVGVIYIGLQYYHYIRNGQSVKPGEFNNAVGLLIAGLTAFIGFVLVVTK
jgi:hypothetical protein